METHRLERYSGENSRTVRPKRATVTRLAAWARSSSRAAAAAESRAAKSASPGWARRQGPLDVGVAGGGRDAAQPGHVGGHHVGGGRPFRHPIRPRLQE